MATATTLDVNAPSLHPGGCWLILDSDARPREDRHWDLVIDYSGYVDAPNRFSLTRYLHEHHDELVLEAAARIDALGHVRCQPAGRTVVEMLEIHQGFSFWYVSGAFEKCIVRNPELSHFLKCLALERLVALHRPSALVTQGLADPACRGLSEIAIRMDVVIDNPATSAEPPRALVSRLRALARFAVLTARSFQLLGCRTWSLVAPGSRSQTALFVAYSANVRGGRNDEYDSVYWKGLPEVVAREFDYVEWAHLYDISAGDSERAVCHRLERVESAAGRSHRLYLLEQGLRPAVVLRAVAMYLRLQWRLPRIEQALAQHRAALGLTPWPFLRDAWNRSTRGGTAASLTVQILLLARLAKLAGRRKATFFLWEGMPWERTLLYFWRRFGNGPAYGHQHATVKTCDMRLLSYVPFGPASPKWLFPDGVLFNGPAAGKALRSLGFEESRLHPVEALRFHHLLELNAAVRVEEPQGQPILVAVVLEGIEPVDRFILELVKAALSDAAVAARGRFVIKPHPSGRVAVGEALGEAGDTWTETREPIQRVFAQADLVCTSINSSAAVEVQALGLPRILVWKPSELIRTSLKVADWTEIVASPAEFVAALNRPPSWQARDREAPAFFLDKALPRWRAVLRQL